jgi:putative transposase
MNKDTVRRTYKYRLYRNNRRDRALRRQITIAGCIWNHALALQKRYYRLVGKHLSLNRLKAHTAKLRNGQRFGWWKALGSQAVQDVLERLDRAWQRFFNKQGRPPKFRKVKKFRSFTLKQAGYKFLGGNKVRIGQYTYKFVKHRDWTGTIKTVTIKRDAANRLWLCMSVEEVDHFPKASSTGDTGGCDFGLRVFLTDHTGQQWDSPQFLLQAMRSLKTLSKSVSRKVEDSHNYKRARWQLNRTHLRITDKRRDFHFKLAHALFDRYDTIVLEDLNIAAMKRLWGRKEGTH